MIFVDPSEVREGSQLPEGIARVAIPLSSLEHHTGADILISPLSGPPLSKLETKLNWKVFEKHLARGVLVQRKTGMDMFNSIPRLSYILEKMIQWNTRPYLTWIRRNVWYDSDGVLKVGKKQFSWHLNSFFGARSSWQTGGGYWEEFDRDDHFTEWCLWMERKLGEGEEVLSHPSVREVFGAHSPDYMILTFFDGMGIVRSRKLWEHCGKNIMGCLFYLAIGKWEDSPKGIPIDVLDNAHKILDAGELDLKGV